jgi:hypothetical protein
MPFYSIPNRPVYPLFDPVKTGTVSVKPGPASRTLLGNQKALEQGIVLDPVPGGPH